jgi:DNA-binding transcriptional regulator YdaS (Cro superfamily)
MNQPLHPLDAVARRVGGREVLAGALGVTLAALGNWKVRGIPIQRCVAIERIGAGAVTRRDLRPDDWQDIWPELADPQPNTAPAPAQQAPVAINSEALEAVQEVA